MDPRPGGSLSPRPRPQRNWGLFNIDCSSVQVPSASHLLDVWFLFAAWQCVERELRTQMSGSERGPVQYVEKNPNPNLNNFTPVDLSDLRKRSLSDAKKS
ncbi:mapk-regulated corepressor-interacting protein 1 [Mobula birostris]|uniref:mapk-regulated corepressor-interacting protein 1 n=1 Tax=Mobula birostris TaxID=1983395 RepID=UPI003B28BD4E